MKKIAITQNIILNNDYYEVREALDVKWGLLFKELNFLPIILPIEYDFRLYFNSLNLDGVLLTGGNSLSSLNLNAESTKRDMFEKELIKYSIANDIPVFGICRGMQIISEYFLATFTKVKNQISIKHKLIANKNSKYFHKIKKIKQVNAFHNYAIDSLPNDFIISATNEDNMIKAIEHTKYKLFGQMWHSERENQFNKDELNLIKYFFNNGEI